MRLIKKSFIARAYLLALDALVSLATITDRSP